MDDSAAANISIGRLSSRTLRGELTTSRIAVTIGALMLLVVGLSFFFFSEQSLRLDEAQSLWQSSRSPGAILTVIAQDVHVPLYHELLHFWRLLVGETVGGARLLSLLFYVLSLPALYFLGKASYGRSAGLFAAFLLALSPFMNWYGNEIRMYTLFTFLTILNQYFFVKLFSKRGTEEQVSNRTWTGYALTAIVGVYSHYFFFLMLLAQGIFFLLRKKLFPAQALQKFITSWGLIGLSFLPWAAYVLIQGQAGNQSPLLITPTTVNLFNAFSEFFFGFQGDHLNTVILSLWPLTIGAAFFALKKSSAPKYETEYFLLAVIVPTAVAFLGSFVIAPVFVSRYLIFTIPPLYLLISSLFAHYPPRVGQYGRIALIGIMAAMLAVEIISPSTPVKENYREAAQFLEQNATAQDIIVLSAPFTIYPVEYYYRGDAAIATLPIWDKYSYGAIPAFSEETLPEDVAKISGKHQNLYLLVSYDQGYQKTVEDYFLTRYEQLSKQNFSPGLDLYVYKLRYDSPETQAISPLSKK